MDRKEFVDTLSFLIERLKSDAYDALNDYRQDKCSFYEGQCLAYYKVLESIKDSLQMSAIDPEKFGLEQEEIDKLLKN